MKERDVHNAVLHFLQRQGHFVLSEYALDCGRVDLYLPQRSIIIEVKKFSAIKHAIGQLVTYNVELPVKSLQCIYFDAKGKMPSAASTRVASSHNIKLINYDELSITT